jgi:hypothetical protein
MESKSTAAPRVHDPTVPPQVPTTVKSSEIKDEPTVLMIFPHPVLLTVHGTKRIEFREGPQKVPASLKNHWYLKAHGVKEFIPGVVTPEQQALADSQERIKQEEAAAAKKKADDEATEAQRIAQQKADDEKRAADAAQVEYAAESARTGKPVEQIKRDRQTKNVKSA